VVWFVLLYLGWIGLEAWPFTSVPMYAQYRDINVNVYPTSTRDIANCRHWFSCRKWNQNFARVLLETSRPGQPKQRDSLFNVVIEKGRLPLHTRTQHIRSLFTTLITACRAKKSERKDIAANLLHRFATWLSDNPSVLPDQGCHADAKYTLTLKLRLAPKKRKKEEDASKKAATNATTRKKALQSDVPYLLVSGVGEPSANGVYRAAKKAASGTLRTRDGAPIFRRVWRAEKKKETEQENAEDKRGRAEEDEPKSKKKTPTQNSRENGGKRLAFRYTVCRAKVKDSEERKWWLFRNEALVASSSSSSSPSPSPPKWSKEDVDLFNVVATDMKPIPPKTGWTALKAAKGSHPPSVAYHAAGNTEGIATCADDASAADADEGKEKDYLLGTLASVPVPTPSDRPRAKSYTAYIASS